MAATSKIRTGFLVIADIRLRGVRSGVELARHARELGIAVLFATASCPDEAADMGIALGVLSKPFQPRELIRSIAISWIHSLFPIRRTII